MPRREIVATWNDELLCWNVPLTKGQFALVDTIDIEWALQFSWIADPTTKGGLHYAKRGCREDGRFRKRALHREIAARMGLDLSQEIDHRNRNPLDNRRHNLRSASRCDNSRNRTSYRSNKTGYKGVHFCRESNRYRAQINVNKKRIVIGRFDTAEEASRAYADFGAKLHGDFFRT